jgi:hypothetical protein
MGKFLLTTLLINLLVCPVGQAGWLDSPKEKMTDTVKKYLNEAGIVTDWQAIDLSFDAENLSNFVITATSKNLNIAVPASGIEATIRDLEVRTTIEIGLSGVKVKRIGPIKMTGIQATIVPTTAPKDPNEPFLVLPSLGPLDLPGMIAEAEVGPIHIQLDALNLQGDQGTTLVKAQVVSKKVDQLQVTVSLKGGSQTIQANLNSKILRSDGKINGVKLNGTYGINGEALAIDGTIDGSLGKTYTLKSFTNLVLDATKMEKISTTMTIAQDPKDQGVTQANLSIRGKIPAAMTGGAVASNLDCHVEARWSEAPNQSLELSTRCGGDATPKSLSLAKELPKKWMIKINGQFRIPRLDLPNPRMDGTLSLDSPKTSSAAITTQLSSKTKVSGNLNGALDQWSLDPTVHINLEVKHFQTLVKSLEESPMPIPASLNTLDGTVKLSAVAKRQGSGLKASTNLETALTGLEQALFMKFSGAVSANHITKPSLIHIDSDLILTKIHLRLPDIFLESPPQMVRDGRFSKRGTPELVGPIPPGPTVTYKILVQTPKESPILLTSNRTRDPIPVLINATLVHDQAPKVRVGIGTFRLDLFKREAKIETFSFVLRDDDEVGDVAGRIAIDYADYDISIDVSGTVAHTLMKMSSEPPLSQNDIYAVLLFGEPMTNIDSGDASSAASLQAATASGAVALTSMYYLASTPVESIHYNPATESISAKMRLGKGTSMSVGREGSNTSRVGIRRKLWGSWFAHTYVDREDTTGLNKVASFLEWSYAY